MLEESGKCPHNAPVKFETIAVHVTEPDPLTGAVAPPIHLATTFTREPDLTLTGDFQYAREGGPTHAQLEVALARLDGGEAALVFASGMAAGLAILQGLNPGDRVILPDDAYYGFQFSLKPRFKAVEAEAKREKLGVWTLPPGRWREVPSTR